MKWLAMVVLVVVLSVWLSGCSWAVLKGEAGMEYSIKFVPVNHVQDSHGFSTKPELKEAKF